MRWIVIDARNLVFVSILAPMRLSHFLSPSFQSVIQLVYIVSNLKVPSVLYEEQIENSIS